MRVTITVIAGPAAGQAFVFDRPDRFLFGRATDAHVSLPKDPYVSRQHFLLEVSPPECKVTDLGSKNGTAVNEKRLGGRGGDADEMQARLKDGDQIQVGDTRLKVAIEAAVVCVECGRSIAPDERSGAAFVGGTFLCADCRRGLASAGTRRAETASKVDPAVERLLNEVMRRRQAAAVPQIDGYRIEKELGRGGMGVVYKGVATASGRPVAIKTMLPQVAASDTAVRLFLREVEVTRQLNHQNVVQLLDHGRAGEAFYFVLEFVEGMDLHGLLRRGGGRLSLKDASPIMLGILDGLAYAHRAQVQMQISSADVQLLTGVVHRDLKPQNILLQRLDGAWIPKVADFGLSKSFESAGLTDMTYDGQVAGTPIYWPREQIIHYRYLSPATDVFSIAAVFYEMLTGARMRDGFDKMFRECQRQGRSPSITDYLRLFAAHPAIPIRDREPSIPPPVAQVLDRALLEAEVPPNEKKMREMLATLRYPDAAAFREALADALHQPSAKA